MRSAKVKCENKTHGNTGKIAWNKGLSKDMQPNFGRKISQEQKDKISKSNKGKIISVEHRAQLSKSMKGNKIWKGMKHNEDTKKKISKSQTGKMNNKWKGGKVKTLSGYFKIHSPNHPNQDNSKYVFEHRLVMEKHIGRYLTKIEVVHHINEIKDDNRIENLKLFKNKGEHKKFHLKFNREELIRLKNENEILKKQIIDGRGKKEVNNNDNM